MSISKYFNIIKCDCPRDWCNFYGAGSDTSYSTSEILEIIEDLEENSQKVIEYLKGITNEIRNK